MLVTLSTNVDSKLTEKTSSGVLSSSSHSHLNLRRHLEGIVFLFPLTNGVWCKCVCSNQSIILLLLLIHHSRVKDHLKFPYWTGDIRLSVHFSSRPIEASVCNADFNVCLPLRQSRPVEKVQCVREVAFCEVLCVVKRQMARRLVINPANVL